MNLSNNGLMFSAFRNQDVYIYTAIWYKLKPFAIKKGRLKLSTPAMCTSHVKLSREGKALIVKSLAIKNVSRPWNQILAYKSMLWMSVVRTLAWCFHTGCPKSSFLYFISLYFSTIGLGKQIIERKVVSFNLIHYFHTCCATFWLEICVLPRQRCPLKAQM